MGADEAMRRRAQRRGAGPARARRDGAPLLRAREPLRSRGEEGGDRHDRAADQQPHDEPAQVVDGGGHDGPRHAAARLVGERVHDPLLELVRQDAGEDHGRHGADAQLDRGAQLRRGERHGGGDQHHREDHDRPDEAVEQPDRRLDLRDLVALVDHHRAEVLGQRPAERRLKLLAHLVGGRGGVERWDGHALSQRVREDLLDPLQCLSDQRQKVELDLVALELHDVGLAPEHRHEPLVGQRVELDPEVVGPRVAQQLEDLLLGEGPHLRR